MKPTERRGRRTGGGFPHFLPLFFSLDGFWTVLVFLHFVSIACCCTTGHCGTRYDITEPSRQRPVVTLLGLELGFYHCLKVHSPSRRCSGASREAAQCRSFGRATGSVLCCSETPLRHSCHLTSESCGGELLIMGLLLLTGQSLKATCPGSSLHEVTGFGGGASSTELQTKKRINMLKMPLIFEWPVGELV